MKQLFAVNVLTLSFLGLSLAHAGTPTEKDNFKSATELAQLEDPKVTSDIFDQYQDKIRSEQVVAKAKSSKDTQVSVQKAPTKPASVKNEAVTAENNKKEMSTKPVADASNYERVKSFFTQAGKASWYGPGFHGRKTANGEIFNMNALTAAHRTLPLGTKIRVTSSTTGKSIVVRVNDRGPYAGNRVLDLSYAAAKALGVVNSGVSHIKLEAFK